MKSANKLNVLISNALLWIPAQDTPVMTNQQ